MRALIIALALLAITAQAAIDDRGTTILKASTLRRESLIFAVYTMLGNGQPGSQADFALAQEYADKITDRVLTHLPQERLKGTIQQAGDWCSAPMNRLYQEEIDGLAKQFGEGVRLSVGLPLGQHMASVCILSRMELTQ